MDGNERLEPELDELELAVLRGQQPIWKELYEEHLNDDARKRVRHAVRKGQALEHPFEAALAAGRAHNVDRGGRWRIPLGVLFVLLVVGPWLYGWCYLADATGWCWFYLAVGVVGIVALPWAWRRTAEHAEQAERLNRSVYMEAVKTGIRLHARPDE